MNIKINPRSLEGKIPAISSKSHAHRLLIAGALSQNCTEIILNKTSKDIDATADCLISLGADIEKYNDRFIVHPIKKAVSGAFLNCGESGSTLRFMIPVAGALGADAVFERQGKLPQRPLSPLKEEIGRKGQLLTDGEKGCLISRGTLKGGEFYLAGNVSSQFITGLLMALPLCNEDSVLHITTPMQSRGYVDLTLDVLRDFNIDITEKENTFYIKGSQKYVSPEYISAQGDWSNAAFWLTAGAFSEKGIEISGISEKSSQGDKAIVDILEKFGAETIRNDNSVIVRKNTLKGITVNAEQIPDIVPEIALLGAAAHGTTVITGAERLRIKESDRLLAIETVLNAIGADVNQTDDGLIIRGRDTLSGGEADSFNDHRIAMMLAIASEICENPVIIKNGEAVRKSYPDFYEDMAKLGGNAERTY